MFDMDSGASMHNAEQRRIKLRYNGYFEKVQNTIMRLTATGCSANIRVSTSFCSWSRSVRNTAILDETPAILLLHQLCSKRWYSYEWKSAKLHNWPKMSRQLFVQWTTLYLLSYQDFHHLPAAARLQYQDQRISPTIPENWEHYQIQ